MPTLPKKNGSVEKDISFPTGDGKTIYGSFNASQKKTCRGLIIYAHGLPSSRDDHTYLQSARMFAKLGYDCLRISFYDWRPNARCLTDCDISTHAHDLETTIKRYAKKYDKIYLIGHSWGGLTIVNTDRTGIAAISLWDPSYNPPFWWPLCSRKQGKSYFLIGGADVLMSADMYKDAMSFDINACRELSARVTVPLQVLHAKKDGILYKFKESYHSYAKGPTDYHLIARADHQFLDETAMAEAVQYTHQWFSRFA